MKVSKSRLIGGGLVLLALFVVAVSAAWGVYKWYRTTYPPAAEDCFILGNTLFWHRQIFSSYRYLQFGTVSEDVRVFHENKNEFVPIGDVTLLKLLPPPTNYLPRSIWEFGVVTNTVGDVDGDGLADPIIGSDYHPCLKKPGYFYVQLLSTRLPPRDGRTEVLSESNSAVLKLAEWGDHLRPYTLGRGSADLDGDGRAEFVVRGRLFFGADFAKNGFTDMKRMESIPVSPSTVFVSGPKGWSIVHAEAEAIVFRRLGPKRTFAEFERISFPDETLKLAAGAKTRLFPLPDVDGDGSGELGVQTDAGIFILFSGDDYKRETGVLISSDQLGTEYVVAAVGDFDGDGADDFWIGDRFARRGRAKPVGAVWLVLNKDLAQIHKEGGDNKTVDLERLAARVLTGTERYLTEGTGGGVPYTIALRAGDLDGDGRPDLTVTSHYALSNAGALYVLLNRDLGRAKEHTIDQPYVRRVVAHPFAYFATGPFHQDNVDYNGDGRDDIVITADVDHEAGFGAGAVYILDGRGIVEQKPAKTSP